MKGRVQRAGLLAALMVASPLTAAHGQQSRSSAPAPLPPITERYAQADAFLAQNLDPLIVDRDLKASFVAHDRGLLFRKGRAGAREWRYLDLATRDTMAIATEPALAAALSAATGKRVAPDELALEKLDYDPATATLSFSRHDTRWTYAHGTLAKAEKGAEEGDEALSPDGRFKIVQRGYDLAAIEVKTGREIALTKGGTRDQPYGRPIAKLPDILEQGTEEPRLPVAVRWSPDSTRILTVRLDTRGVQRLTMTQENPPGSLYPRSFSYIYPTAGAEKIPEVTRLIIDVADAFADGHADIVAADVPSEGLTYPDIPDMGWMPDGSVRIQWTARGYKELVVYRVDPENGAANIVAREAVKPVVTITSSFLRPAPDLGGELDVSERSGWAQLWFVSPSDPDGGVPLTRGEWEVISVDHVDAEGKFILATGVGRERNRNPYYRALYRVSLKGEAPVLLTPEPLDHDVTVSDDGKWFVDRMSSPTTPTRTLLRDATDGHVVMELGRADPSALLAKGYTMPEPFQGVAADGKTPLWGMIFRPAHFNPHRAYPVIDAVYTGPTTTQVPTTFDGAVLINANSVAQIGAVVVAIDGRGTSRRGQAFRLPAYQNLGEVGLDDHIAMIRQMAARYPYLDTSRVGVYGGSAGGYDAARFVLRRPNFFKVAVSSSGNHDLRLDKAWWPETSMGIADVATWDRNSNMSVAGNLQGKLLLIHGDIDDNVPVTESLRLANALIQANRNVDLVILPNTTHRVAQPFFWRKLRDYFTRNLLGEAPPATARIVPDEPGALANK
ncbi:MAG TPA: DPP IV N-terminal domain-containing protein [Sphingomonas sp.]|nr:DPP IV N-terminal domain-containing protein [Sphingomonas sp.]